MEHTWTFIGVAPEAVLAEFVDPEFLIAFSTEVGVDSGDLNLDSADGVESAEMPWRFPTDRPGIPSLARKFLPAEVHLDWSQRWGPVTAAPIAGTIHVALHGSPSADVRAESALAAPGGGHALPRPVHDADEPAMAGRRHGGEHDRQGTRGVDPAGAGTGPAAPAAYSGGLSRPISASRPPSQRRVHGRPRQQPDTNPPLPSAEASWYRSAHDSSTTGVTVGLRLMVCVRPRYSCEQSWKVAT